jgi:hypothetical protein
MNTNYQSDKEVYSHLIGELAAENERAQEDDSLENRCKIGIRKLHLVRKFSEIDQELLNLSANPNDSYSSDFFSGILYFESKRLMFKEEVLKCLTLADQLTNKNKTRIAS